MHQHLFIRPVVRDVAVVALVALMALVSAANAQTAADPGTPEARAEAAFKRADLDGDGKLSRAEIEKLPALASRFDELDKDKDGFISWAEFLAGTAAAK